MNWKKMDSAPRDGSAFLVQHLPYAPASLCMRRVQYYMDSGGDVKRRDLGGWIHVGGVQNDLEDHCETVSRARPEWAIAPDRMNQVEAWRWTELPTAPQEILDQIRTDLGWAA